MIAAILRRWGATTCTRILRSCTVALIWFVVTVKKSRLEIQHWFGMKIGGVVSRFVPKRMSIELINWKKFQHIVQPGRTSGTVAIGSPVLLQSKTF